MNKRLFCLIALTAPLSFQSLQAIPFPKQAAQYGAPQDFQDQQAPDLSHQGRVYLQSGQVSFGALNHLPSLGYPFGKINIPIEDVKTVKFSNENGTPKIYVQTKNGLLFIGDLSTEEILEFKFANGEIRRLPFTQIASIDFNNGFEGVRPAGEARHFSVEFKDGTLLPVDIGDFTLVLNDGQKDFTINAHTLVDVHNDKGLHGIIRSESGQYKHIPLAILKDDSIMVRPVGSSNDIDINWKNIGRIYQHNVRPEGVVTHAQETPAPASSAIEEQIEAPSQAQVENAPALDQNSEALLIAPMIGKDGKTQFYRVVGRMPGSQKQAGATFSAWPTDIVLIGEEFDYEPRKRGKESLVKDEGDEAADAGGEFIFTAESPDIQNHLKANGGAIRKPLLAQCCILKDEPIAFADSSKVNKPLKKEFSNNDSYQDEEGYYKGPRGKIGDENEPDTLPHDPDLAGMVFINSEKVLCASDDRGPRAVEAVGAYYIDKYPVTNKQYYRFVKATNHLRPKHWLGGRIPKGQDLQPVVNITYDDALAYAEWAGKRLPTTFEWCKAHANDLIKSTTKKTLKEWTATAFMPFNESRAENNWLDQHQPAYMKSVYRAVVGAGITAPLPTREDEIALNIGFRTALEAE